MNSLLLLNEILMLLLNEILMLQCAYSVRPTTAAVFKIIMTVAKLVS
jgi:hypothetical protein